jgi:hypothetical protein
MLYWTTVWLMMVVWSILIEIRCTNTVLLSQVVKFTVFAPFAFIAQLIYFWNHKVIEHKCR